MNLYSNLFKLLFKFSNVMNDLNFQENLTLQNQKLIHL